MHELGAGFFLHDLGKVEVDASIINKPGKLTEEEMSRMRQHPHMGYKLLYETNELTHECKKIVLQHHERYDGKGYPNGLQGNDIHLYGRICSIADVFDALEVNERGDGTSLPRGPLRTVRSAFQVTAGVKDVCLSGEGILKLHQFVFMMESRCRSISSLGRAPTSLFSSSPSLKSSIVGILRTSYFDAVRGFSSIFSFTTLMPPAYFAASSSMIGPSVRHGAHHGAQRSIRTAPE
jgi:hypothetical protein